MSDMHSMATKVSLAFSNSKTKSEQGNLQSRGRLSGKFKRAVAWQSGLGYLDTLSEELYCPPLYT